MRGIGDDDGLARVAFRFVIGAREQDSGELAMRARCRLQRDCVHTGDFDETFLQQPHDFKRALGERFGLIGVRFSDSFEARDELVDTRVVFHRATAERVHAEIDGIVPG